MQDFRRLAVWERSHQFALKVYRLTAAFPRDEQFGLTSQMRRAACSIPTNISEACGRGGSREMMVFLRIAFGSASEVDYQLLLARDLGYSTPQGYDVLSNEISGIKKMLAGLMKAVDGKSSGNARPTREVKSNK